MPRQPKNYCDYFTHDRDMRNHRKIKAIRNKFGISGYAIWNMLLEYLTGIDGNEFENSDVEIELISGDFGVSATEIRQVIDYCISLELLFENNRFIHSQSLDERLKPVYDKRGAKKESCSKQRRSSGRFVKTNTVSNGDSAPEIPQSILEYIRVDKSILNNNSWDSEKNHFLQAEEWQMKQCSHFGISKDQLMQGLNTFLDRLEKQEDFKDQKELKRHFHNWYTKNKDDLLRPKPKLTYQEETARRVQEFQKNLIRE